MIAFFLKATDKSRLDKAIFLSQYGSEPEPVYSIRRPDPSNPAQRNRYAVALYDSFNPEVLFAEVLIVPQWTQPSLSAEAVRLNGGVPPPPEPIQPTEFTIQLYNPDQQVTVRQRPGSWKEAPYWEFEMPQYTFRQPSGSVLDRTQSDPSTLDVTPKINFKWKKEGKLSKDLLCTLSGKTNDAKGNKRKYREPDITVALFRNLREITLYEPNMHRVEIEDFKGLEVILLLGATVIREVFYGQMKEVFNITEPPRKNSNPTSPTQRHASSPVQLQASQMQPANPRLSGIPPNTSKISPQPPRRRESHPPPADPRSQWEIDAETARLKQQVEAEERERERRERHELRKAKRIAEQEEKETRRKQAEIEKETQRLQKMYGEENRKAAAQRMQPPHPQPPRVRPHSAPFQQQLQQPQQWSPRPQQGPYLQAPGAPGTASASGFLSPNVQVAGSGQKLREKKSFFGFKRSVDDGGKLQKKKSSMFQSDLVLACEAQAS